jgi:hypothetical protein
MFVYRKISKKDIIMLMHYTYFGEEFILIFDASFSEELNLAHSLLET